MAVVEEMELEGGREEKGFGQSTEKKEKKGNEGDCYRAAYTTENIRGCVIPLI